jgi:hypothetical protein
MFMYGWHRDMHSMGLTYWVGGCPYGNKDSTCSINMKGMMKHAHLGLVRGRELLVGPYITGNDSTGTALATCELSVLVLYSCLEFSRKLGTILSLQRQTAR